MGLKTQDFLKQNKRDSEETQPMKSRTKVNNLGVGKTRKSYGFDNSNQIYVNKGTEVK